MSHAHRRMHRRWSGEIPARPGPVYYTNRRTAEMIRQSVGIPPSTKRWRKKEARRQWRARFHRMRNEALISRPRVDWRSLVRMATCPLEFHGVPIASMSPADLTAAMVETMYRLPDPYAVTG